MIGDLADWIVDPPVVPDGYRWAAARARPRRLSSLDCRDQAFRPPPFLPRRRRTSSWGRPTVALDGTDGTGYRVVEVTAELPNGTATYELTAG